MDECRFDNLTRVFSAIRDRRMAIKEMAGAGAAVLALARADLGFAQEDDVLIEGCRLTGERCGRNNQCCSDKCNRRRRRRRKNDRDGGGDNRNRRRRRRRRDNGKCGCLGNGKKCNKDAACCKGRCEPGERRCRCVPANDICNRSDDCCGNRECRNGFCKNRN